MDCGYYMCHYEKGNIDALILMMASHSQTVMFGEIHDTVLEGGVPPVEDSLYVVSLLPKMRAIGYAYLALEVDKHTANEGHSQDMVDFHNAYQQSLQLGTPLSSRSYRHAKPGWIELMKSAMDAGFEVHFIDVPVSKGPVTRPRDKAMFDNLKAEIFNHDKDAKVIIYIGANHIGETETHTGIYLYKGKRRPLGYFLDAYTAGRNVSVYMGHVGDTPKGCDLFISDFIWDIYRQIIRPNLPAD